MDWPNPRYSPLAGVKFPGAAAGMHDGAVSVLARFVWNCCREAVPNRIFLCPDVVPVYHLGQSQLLTFWGPERLSRRWRASIGIFWGAWGLPLPRKHPIISLVGAPIPGMHMICYLISVASLVWCSAKSCKPCKGLVGNQPRLATLMTSSSCSSKRAH